MTNITIKNETLSAEITAHGAELQRLTTAQGKELLWDGKADIWPNRAPVCFPWCGPVEGGWFETEGRRCEAATRHGFIRDMDFAIETRSEGDVIFRLDWPGSEHTWPWSFAYRVRYYLEGDGLHTVATVENTSPKPMPVQQGFHTALVCPFLPDTVLEDYIVRFESGRVVELTEHLFDNDSIRYEEPTAWVQIEHRASGAYLRHRTAGYKCVLLWSKPGRTGFVCVEPWSGWPDESHALERRPGTALLQPGEGRSWEQEITVALSGR